MRAIFFSKFLKGADGTFIGLNMFSNLLSYDSTRRSFMPLVVPRFYALI